MWPYIKLIYLKGMKCIKMRCGFPFFFFILVQISHQSKANHHWIDLCNSFLFLSIPALFFPHGYKAQWTLNHSIQIWFCICIESWPFEIMLDVLCLTQKSGPTKWPHNTFFVQWAIEHMCYKNPNIGLKELMGPKRPQWIPNFRQVITGLLPQLRGWCSSCSSRDGGHMLMVG